MQLQATSLKAICGNNTNCTINGNYTDEIEVDYSLNTLTNYSQGLMLIAKNGSNGNATLETFVNFGSTRYVFVNGSKKINNIINYGLFSNPTSSGQQNHIILNNDAGGDITLGDFHIQIKQDSNSFNSINKSSSGEDKSSHLTIQTENSSSKKINLNNSAKIILSFGGGFEINTNYNLDKLILGYTSGSTNNGDLSKYEFKNGSNQVNIASYLTTYNPELFEIYTSGTNFGVRIKDNGEGSVANTLYKSQILSINSMLRQSEVLIYAKRARNPYQNPSNENISNIVPNYSFVRNNRYYYGASIYNVANEVKYRRRGGENIINEATKPNENTKSSQTPQIVENKDLPNKSNQMPKNQISNETQSQESQRQDSTQSNAKSSDEINKEIESNTQDSTQSNEKIEAREDSAESSDETESSKGEVESNEDSAESNAESSDEAESSDAIKTQDDKSYQSIEDESLENESQDNKSLDNEATIERDSTNSNEQNLANDSTDTSNDYEAIIISKETMEAILPLGEPKNNYFFFSPFVSYQSLLDGGGYGGMSYGFVGGYNYEWSKNLAGLHFGLSYGGIESNTDNSKQINLKSLGVMMGVHYKRDFAYGMYLKSRLDAFYFSHTLKDMLRSDLMYGGMMLEEVKPSNLAYNASIAFGKEWLFGRSQYIGLEGSLSYMGISGKAIELMSESYKKSLVNLAYVDINTSYDGAFGSNDEWLLNTTIGLKTLLLTPKITLDIGEGYDINIGENRIAPYAQLGFGYNIAQIVALSLSYLGTFGDKSISHSGFFNVKVWW